ncbi:hypothetical protein [Hydrogenophaga sp.]|uniref:hypothetical protein n=1 Tax=Hydrogenophaga sp. TaxID=1904254 RepID=UPI003D13F3A8
MATNESIRSQKIDLQDVVETKARQLRSLLFVTYGEETSGREFRGMSDELQDAYMWACADMAHDIVKALDGISELSSKETEARHA